MKNNIKSYLKWNIIMLLCLLLFTGCGKTSSKASKVSKDDNNTINSNIKIESNNNDANKTTEKTDKVNKLDNQDDNSKETAHSTERKRYLFSEALAKLYWTGEMPDGTYRDDYSEGKCGWYDVDNDGGEELIICYDNSSNSLMTYKVYDYDMKTNQIYLEIEGYPSFKFYDNGTIIIEDSHDHSMGSQVWPYSLYDYDKTVDKYNKIAEVEAWDKSVSEKNYSGELFPSELDKDGNGVIYLVKLNSETQDTYKYDDKEYKEWINSYIGDSQIKNYELIDVERGRIQGFSDYFAALIKNYEDTIKENKHDIDIGVTYIKETDGIYNIKGEIEKLQNFYFAEGKNTDILNSWEDGYYVNVHTVSIQTNFPRNVLYCYYVDGLTMFGVYPGMDKNTAIKCLSHFDFKGVSNNKFEIAGGAEEIYVDLTIENEKVTSINVSSFLPHADY